MTRSSLLNIETRPGITSNIGADNSPNSYLLYLPLYETTLNLIEETKGVTSFQGDEITKLVTKDGLVTNLVGTLTSNHNSVLFLSVTRLEIQKMYGPTPTFWSYIYTETPRPLPHLVLKFTSLPQGQGESEISEISEIAKIAKIAIGARRSVSINLAGNHLV